MSAEHFHQAHMDIDRSDIHNEHGVFSFEDDNITVVSQPKFDDTLEAITQLDDSGTTILTPELALLDDSELSDFLTDKAYRENEAVVKNLRRRFFNLKKATRRTSNTILIGMPIIGEGNYYNGLQAVQGSRVEHTQRKANPGMFEQNLNVFEYAKEPEVYHRLGATALICSELLYVSRLNQQLKQDTQKLLVSAAWGVPTTTPAAVLRHPTLDAYHASNLDRSVAMAAKKLPQLDTVYIADRSLGDSRPQSGRITIHHHNDIETAA